MNLLWGLAAFHMGDPCVVELILIKSFHWLPGAYLAFHNLAHGELGLVIQFHHIRAPHSVAALKGISQA